jgi:hypothetical protein
MLSVASSVLVGALPPAGVVAEKSALQAFPLAEEATQAFSKFATE